MALQQVLIDVGKEKVNQLKSFLDDLEVQMALGKMEAKDAFESEKKNLNKFIQKEKAAIQNVAAIGAEHRNDLRLKFEKLEGVLSRPFATGKRKFDKDKKEALTAIYEVEAIMKEAYGDVNYTIQQELNSFKAKLDTYRVQLALGTYEDEAALKTRKAALKETIGKIREKLAKDTESGSRVETFFDEVGESFDHMKKAFSDLFA